MPEEIEEISDGETAKQFIKRIQARREAATRRRRARAIAEIENEEELPPFIEGGLKPYIGTWEQ